MKKILTLLAATILGLSVADAQVKTAPVALQNAPQSAMGMTAKKAGVAKAQKRIDLETGERIAGYYDTDYLPELLGDGYGGMGYVNITGEVKAADVFEPDMIKKFVGGEITKIRFALADSETTLSNAFIMETNGYNYLSGYTNVVAEVDLSDYTPQVGWNDVTLDTPVTIQEGKYYVIGFQYTQTSSNYPLVTDEYFDDGFYSSTYGFLLYMNADYGLDWYAFDQGHLCIQAIVKGGDFPDYDISLNNLTLDKYALAGSDLNYSYDIRNYGEKLPTSYTIKVSVDDVVMDEQTDNDPVTIGSAYTTINGTVYIPDDMEVTADGHTLKVRVDQINGETPTSGTADDELEGTFVVYDKSVDRQMHLIEEFTSVQCGYCPLGHETLDKLQAYKPGKYALVANHVLGMGNDPYAVSSDYMNYFDNNQTMNYLEYFLSISAYPMASFDRAILADDDIPGSDAISFEIGYDADYQETLAELVDAAVDNYYSTVPAFVPVNIDANYSYDTNVLNVVVSGTGVDIAKDLLGDDVLNVFLIEDGLVNYQENYSGQSSYSYVHNNVLRRPLSYCYGDAIDWINSSSYENNYSLKLDSGWVPGHLKIVAFISGPMLRFVGTAAYWTSQETAYVNNCNMLALSDTEGIGTIVSVGTDATEVARYAVDGTRLAAPAKGINLVKMSDGSVRKVVK